MRDAMTKHIVEIVTPKRRERRVLGPYDAWEYEHIANPIVQDAILRNEVLVERDDAGTPTGRLIAPLIVSKRLNWRIRFRLRTATIENNLAEVVSSRIGRQDVRVTVTHNQRETTSSYRQLKGMYTDVEVRDIQRLGAYLIGLVMSRSPQNGVYDIPRHLLVDAIQAGNANNPQRRVRLALGALNQMVYRIQAEHCEAVSGNIVQSYCFWPFVGDDGVWTLTMPIAEAILHAKTH